MTVRDDIKQAAEARRLVLHSAYRNRVSIEGGKQPKLPLTLRVGSGEDRAEFTRKESTGIVYAEHLPVGGIADVFAPDWTVPDNTYYRWWMDFGKARLSEAQHDALERNVVTEIGTAWTDEAVKVRDIRRYRDRLVEVFTERTAFMAPEALHHVLPLVALDKVTKQEIEFYRQGLWVYAQGLIVASTTGAPVPDSVLGERDLGRDFRAWMETKAYRGPRIVEDEPTDHERDVAVDMSKLHNLIRPDAVSRFADLIHHANTLGELEDRKAQLRAAYWFNAGVWSTRGFHQNPDATRWMIDVWGEQVEYVMETDPETGTKYVAAEGVAVALLNGGE